MKVTVIIGAVATIGFALLVATDLVAGADESTCDNYVGALKKRKMHGLQECFKQLGLNTPKEQEDNMGCAFKCAMANEKFMMTDKFTFFEPFETWLKNEIPSNLFDKVSPYYRKCKENSEKDISQSDKTCPGYLEVATCSLKAFDVMCKA